VDVIEYNNGLIQAKDSWWNSSFINRNRTLR